MRVTNKKISHSLVLFCWHIPSLDVCLDFYFRKIPTCQNANAMQKLSLFSLSVHAVGTSQSKRPEYVLYSSRFSSNKGALKDLFLVLFVNTCPKRRPKENFFFKFIWLVCFVCISSTATYNLASWQTHSQKIEMCWD